MISLELLRQWDNSHDQNVVMLEKTGQRGKEAELLFMWESNQNVSSSTQG